MKLILLTKAQTDDRAKESVLDFFSDLENYSTNDSVFVEYYKIGGEFCESLFPMAKTYRTIVVKKLMNPSKKVPYPFYIPMERLKKYSEWLKVTWEEMGGVGEHCYTVNHKRGFPEYAIRPLKECADLILKNYKNPIIRAGELERKSKKENYTNRIKNGDLPNWSAIGFSKIAAGKLLSGLFQHGESFYNIVDRSYEWPEDEDMKEWWAVEVEYD